MTSERSHIEDAEEDYDDAEVAEPEDVGAFGAEEEDEQASAAAGGDEDLEGASLDELLAQRAASKRGADDNEEESDIMLLASESSTPVPEPLAPVRVAPVRDREEFVCRSCHLVKPKVQLVDPQRGLCRDCA